MFSEHLNSYSVLCILCLVVTGVPVSGVHHHFWRRGIHENEVEKDECMAGEMQSPIDIDLYDTVPLEDFEALHFNDPYRNKIPLNVKNDGHTIKASLSPAITFKPIFWGGGLEGRFVFEQLHFHWDSEHTIDRKRYPLEMHMVHYNEKYKDMNEALNHKDGVAVLAILFDHNSPKNHEMNVFFQWVQNNIIYSSEEETNFITDKEEVRRSFFYLRNMLPLDPNRFLRYNGSLTTPPCNEVVQWTIFLERQYVSEEMLRDLRKLKDHHGHLIYKNYREPQPLNGRQVFIQKRKSIINEGNSITLSSCIIVTCFFFHFKLIV